MLAVRHCPWAIFCCACALVLGGAPPERTLLGATPSATAASQETVPGGVTSLTIETGMPADGPCLVRGRDMQQQLVVMAQTAEGGTVDVTRAVRFVVAPPAAATVDATGLLTPLTDGRVVVEARLDEHVTARREFELRDVAIDLPINFANQVTPVFTKYQCNGGGCHGKSGGQNGFALSLLGFEPDEDYEHLVHEGRGRRLFPAAPDSSLLLQKAINEVPHGGGQRMAFDSPEYRLLRRWIRQGMPLGQADDPRVSHIEVLPAGRSMRPGDRQQLIVTAHYTDGSVEDVTRLAQYEANVPEMAEISATGLVETADLAGNVAVMARYQSQVAVFRASIPLGVELAEFPATRNFVDELVFSRLRELGIPPSAVCDDATFLRRLTIDLAGRLPTPDEVEAFLASTETDKRDAAIDRLLASGDHADYFAGKWNAVLRNKRSRPTYTRGTYAFRDWIRQQIYTNRPYDEFVRDILAASGDINVHPPVAWYREVKTLDEQVEDAAQLFLGMRIQCARCHHHPFEKWSQQDYYHFAAFFTQVERKPGRDVDELRIMHKRGAAGAMHPKTGQRLAPTGLDAPLVEIPADRDPRHVLVDWLRQPENPFFAPALANRYWKHLLGRGLVEPEDDMRVTNPATSPQLLEALSRHFVDSGFDMKELLRVICQSHTYQLSAEPNEHNQGDRQNHSRYYPKRLTAEVLLDAFDTVTGVPTKFAGLPPQTRAVQLPDTSFDSYFLTVFGRPQSASACECERVQDASLAQSLHLLNSADLQAKLTHDQGLAAQLAADTQPLEARIGRVYLTALSRQPTAEELAAAVEYVQTAENPRAALEDIVWALVNTKEFLFNH